MLKSYQILVDLTNNEGYKKDKHWGAEDEEVENRREYKQIRVTNI